MSNPKPVTYSLHLYDGSFDDDCAGLDATTPFLPLSVGDYVEHRHYPVFAFSNTLRKDQAYRVAAVKHSIQDLDSHYSQIIEVCLEIATKPNNLFPSSPPQVS